MCRAVDDEERLLGSHWTACSGWKAERLRTRWAGVADSKPSYTERVHRLPLPVTTGRMLACEARKGDNSTLRWRGQNVASGASALSSEADVHILATSWRLLEKET